MIREEKMMHARVLSLLIVSAALLCATAGASAQTAYSYPWCGTNGGGGSRYYAPPEQGLAPTAGGPGRQGGARPHLPGASAGATTSDATVAPNDEANRPA